MHSLVVFLKHGLVSETFAARWIKTEKQFLLQMGNGNVLLQIGQIRKRLCTDASVHGELTKTSRIRLGKTKVMDFDTVVG